MLVSIKSLLVCGIGGVGGFYFRLRGDFRRMEFVKDRYEPYQFVGSRATRCW
jgi:hypothetical protein